MIEAKTLPMNFVAKTEGSHGQLPKVEKRILKEIHEIQCLTVSPWTKIQKHYHKDSQWEIWVLFEKRTAYICLAGESHELVNNTGKVLTLMAMKGHNDYSYEDFEEIFRRWGFNVKHGSVIINY